METPKTSGSGSEPAKGAEAPVAPGIVSAGWLAADSVFERKDKGRLGGAVGTSAAVHGAILALLVFVTMKPEVITQPIEHMRVVFLQQPPGPGGGGGGSPAPAPKRQVEIPKPKAEPIPVTPPVVVPPPPPIPTLSAPVMTNTQNLLQSSGTSRVALSAPLGGGGTGGGQGEGRGRGVGPGEEAGFGGGLYRGGGLRLVRRVDPLYTSDAMRAKIQGMVTLSAEVLENGTIGRVEVVKSLDRNYGLDQQAIVAAKGWLFVPPKDAEGRPVKALVTLELEFRLY